MCRKLFKYLVWQILLNSHPMTISPFPWLLASRAPILSRCSPPLCVQERKSCIHPNPRDCIRTGFSQHNGLTSLSMVGCDLIPINDTQGEIFWGEGELLRKGFLDNKNDTRKRNAIVLCWISVTPPKSRTEASLTHGRWQSRKVGRP